jgi:3-oxoacyl-[acyl-carrier protein] reductase
MNPEKILGPAVVLGGSGGIGAATARAFAAAGARVAIAYKSDEAAARAALASLAGQGHAVFRADVTDTASLERLAADTRAAFGEIATLINAAGFTKAVPHGDLEALDDAFIDRMFEANWRGQFAAVRAFRKTLEASGQGLVVNVSSIAGQNGVGSNIAYCAVKAGIDVMTKSLARALAPAIRVMAVSPGVVATDFVPGRGAEALAKIAPTIPLKRVGTADDVARAILACATHLDYSTGSIVLVDGGRAL